MTIRPILPLALLTALALPAAAQSAPPAFQVADIHQSPLSKFPFTIDAALRGDRYILRQRTMAELIATAYGIDAPRVFGGPPWLERDRYDIIAQAPPGTTPATLNLMLQALLAERFHVVVHHDMRPMPAYHLLLLNPRPNLHPADTSVDPSCKNVAPPREPGSNILPKIHFTCRNMSMEGFARNLEDWGNDYFPQPIVEATGLKDAFDFDLSWTFKGQLQRAGADGTTLGDALEKQLGLKLELRTAPRPVLVVDAVDEKPTPNRPDLDKVFPPPAPPEFEVATIRPSKPGATDSNAHIGGSSVEATNMTLKFMIDFAWDLNPQDNEAIANAPKWLDSTHFDIQAKAATPAPTNTRNPPPMDPEELRAMLRQLLAERFNLKTHTEPRPITAYTLLAPNPKLKPADPTQRTSCKEGPGPDGKDPRIANPMLGRLLFCRNMNMAQFAQELQTLAPGFIYGDVLDATHLTGGFDFLLSFSSSGQLQSGADPSASGVSDPNGALSLFDAVNRELGLKLEKQKRPMPVLVIDHIDEKPTEN